MSWKSEKKTWERFAENGIQVDSGFLYNETASSLKDAVLLFGSGCTGSVISSKGLVLTNHHCGFDYISKLSTVGKDLLKNGFWAKNNRQELPCPGLTVSLLSFTRDVTEKVKTQLPDTFKQAGAWENALKEVIKGMEKENSVNGITAQVKSFYGGNRFVLFGYKVYKDLRLVGNPPESAGKFGEDNDNWMWPRHTADFSLFRIYVGKDNQPAEYSADNVPFRPDKFLEVSAQTVQENDPVFIIGFPARTTEYLLSPSVSLIQQDDDPIRISARTTRLGIWNAAMKSSDSLRLMYASRYNSVANGWKKWQGEILGLKKMQVSASKSLAEKQYVLKKEKEFVPLQKSLNEVIGRYKPLNAFRLSYNELFLGIDAFAFADKLAGWAKEAKKMVWTDSLSAAQSDAMRKEVKKFFREFSADVDRQVFLKFYPEFIAGLKKNPAAGMVAENKLLLPSPELIAGKVYSSPVLFADSLNQWFRNPSQAADKILKSDLVMFTLLVTGYYNSDVKPALLRAEADINKVNRMFQAFLLEHFPDSIAYPDANSTLRFSFGKAKGYVPRNGVAYSYFTTADGIMEKNLSGSPDYAVDSLLSAYIQRKDYGPYAAPDGSLRTCFISTCHTTGGNSGSPVFNKKGQLTGLNFDRCWEGTMSDIEYNETFCRNIMMDMHYLLFFIDRIGGAKHLFDEMKIQWQ